MRTWLVRYLQRLVAWLEPPVVDVPMLAPALDPLDVLTDTLVTAADALPGTPDGEYKRHWVYGRLVKAFPDRRRREIGLAIELAIAARGESVAPAPRL